MRYFKLHAICSCKEIFAFINAKESKKKADLPSWSRSVKDKLEIKVTPDIMNLQKNMNNLLTLSTSTDEYNHTIYTK